MKAARMAGYTVVEVSLFLAISGLLFMIAIIGTGNIMRSVRFSDMGRNVHAFVQQQYDEILNGVNDRDSQQVCTNSGVSEVSNPAEEGDQAGSSQCLLLGKLLRFEPGTDVIETYRVVAARIPNLSVTPDASLDDEALIRAVSPHLVRVAKTEYSIPWGATNAGSRRNDGLAANTYLLLRSPRSSRIVSYTLNIPAATFATLNALEDVLTTSATEKPTNYCFQTAEVPTNRAAITVGNQGQNAIAIAFDVANEGVCDGAL